jgi:hypothetical protein
MQFDLFKYHRRLILFFTGIPISFALFILSFLISWILFKEQFPVAWLFIGFILFSILTNIEVEIVSYFRFYQLGEIIITDDKIIVNSKNGNKEYLLNEIRNMKIYYAGDRYWKPLIKIFRKSKGRSRYISVHWSRKEDELKWIDKIYIDNEEYQIKIRNQEEKDILLNLISFLKRKRINLLLEGEIELNLKGT